MLAQRYRQAWGGPDDPRIMGDDILTSTQSLSASRRGIRRDGAAREGRVRVGVQHCRPLALSLFNPPLSVLPQHRPGERRPPQHAG